MCGKDDDSYLGYSVTTGEFNGDGDKLDVAVGMPRGANLTGKVTFKFHIFTVQGPYTGQSLFKVKKGWFIGYLFTKFWALLH